jgi:hypothetical protein
MKRTLLLLTLLFSAVLFSQAQINRASVGKKVFYFKNKDLDSPMKVFYYSSKADADDLPIVLLLHGAHRDASAYMDDVIQTANLYNCKVIAPEFDQENFPGVDGYNLGNVNDRKTKKLLNANKWAFSVLEPLFDTVVAQTKSNAKGYYLYGHSGGAQFGHRFLMFVPNNRVIKASFANAGWYTMPNNVEYPFGVQKSIITTQGLTSFFNKKVFILLGTADTDRESNDFNKSAEADDQGKSRFERGKTFFTAAEKKAEEMKTKLNWTEIFVPGVGHDNKEMSKFSFAMFFMNLNPNDQSK